MRAGVLVEVRCAWRCYRTVLAWLTDWPGGADYQVRQETAPDGAEEAVFTVEPEARDAVRAALASAVEWREPKPPMLANQDPTTCADCGDVLPYSVVTALCDGCLDIRCPAEDCESGSQVLVRREACGAPVYECLDCGVVWSNWDGTSPERQA